MESNPRRAHGPSTASVHAGRSDHGASVSLPLDRSSTFVTDERAYAARAAGDPYSIPVYAREAAPTVLAVERRLAALEGAGEALLWSSGMAALHGALMACLETGQRVAVAAQCYGGTFGLLEVLAPKLGVEVVRFDAADPATLDPQLDRRLSVVICESLSNPTLVVADLPALAARAHSVDARLIVDATLVTPIGQRPLEHGADLVWHSASKYLGGHSDLIGGVLAGPTELVRATRTWRTKAGGSADSGMAWLVERGLKTLALRVERHTVSARRIAAFLASHPAVARVHHPTLAAPAQRELASRLITHEAGLLAFEVAAGDTAATEVMRRLTLFAEAPSFGGVESLVSPPARMSHAGLSSGDLAAAGIGRGCLRLAVGIEDPEDLEADLEQALA